MELTYRIRCTLLKNVEGLLKFIRKIGASHDDPNNAHLLIINSTKLTKQKHMSKYEDIDLHKFLFKNVSAGIYSPVFYCEKFENFPPKEVCENVKDFMMFTTQTQEDWISKKIKNNKKLIDTPENELVERYDLDRCCEWIRKNNYQTTCLQFPESLLNDGTSIILHMQNELERPIYLLADTSYGSCCVDEVAAQHVDADSIIHFGHSCLSPVMKLPVLYVFEKDDLDMRQLRARFEIFGEDTHVIVFYDDVFHHLYTELCSVFEDHKNVTISRLQIIEEKLESDDIHVTCGRAFVRKSNETQISAVYVGNESITLENLVLALPDFRWYRYNTEEAKLEEYNMNRMKFLMQRSHLVEKIKSAKVIGILIGTLGIVNYLDAIERIKLLVKQRGKKHYMLAVGKPNVAKLANFPEIDVFVYIACQENQLLKDFKDYYKPVVSLFEIEMALGDRSYSPAYTSNFRDLLPGGAFYCSNENDSEETVRNSGETSQELLEKNPGTLVEYAGAQFLSNRTWRGLEQRIGETEVSKAVEGRAGIPQGYENELETLSERNE